MTGLEKQDRKYDPNFGSFIKNARKEKFPSLSGRKFAKEIGITGAYLSNIEADIVRPPSVQVVIALAEKLGLDKHNLLSMAGRVDPALVPILFDAPPEIIQAIKFMENQCSEYLNGFTFAHIIGLFFFRFVESPPEKELTPGDTLRIFADVLDTILEKNLSTDEISENAEKGLSILRELISENHEIRDNERNDSD